MSEKKETAKEYSNGEVTVVWQPDLCIHSGICVRGLSSVFDVKKRPWINIEGADTDAIIAQVKKCPSGALSYFMNKEEIGTTEIEVERIVEASPDGPLMVYGNLLVRDSAGNEKRHHKVTAFCRCGASSNKPYCDGTHRKIGFKG